MYNGIVDRIREDFPALKMEAHGKPMVFLDSAATSLKPIPVIDAVSEYYKTFNANVHRGSYHISQLASEAFDQVRHKIGKYLNADSSDEIIFTKGTTEAINLLAHCVQDSIGEGDEIVVTEMEHHANIIPWQQLCLKNKATLRVVPVDQEGALKLDVLKNLLNQRTKILAITHISNVLGTINPLREIIELAHRYGSRVVVDGAQGIVHGPVNVRELDCDFYCFSGHKVYAPMGVGVLYGKAQWLKEMPPYQWGGAMIDRVSFSQTTFKEAPLKFEAGTPNVSGVIGLGQAFDYISGIGWGTIQKIEGDLLQYANRVLSQIKGLRVLGNTPNKAPILAMHVDGIHSYDLGTLLDQFGVACRTGNHCTQPLHEVLGVKGTTRASFAFYNTREEIDIFADALERCIEMLK